MKLQAKCFSVIELHIVHYSNFLASHERLTTKATMPNYRSMCAQTRSVSLQNDITTYWPGMHTYIITFLVVSAETTFFLNGDCFNNFLVCMQNFKIQKKMYFLSMPLSCKHPLQHILLTSSEIYTSTKPTARQSWTGNVLIS